MRIAIVGNGKMGRAVAALAVERGHTIHTVIDAAENEGGRALTRERLDGADVAVEFTHPEAATVNLVRLLEAGMPTVVGTTGWAAAMPRIEALATQRRGALLHAANFSVGVHLFLRAAQDLARTFAGRREFDAFLVEEHHAAKVDAPSGTALLLQQRLRAGETPDRNKRGNEGNDAERGGSERTFPITSIRAGSIPGTHEVVYDGPFETVRLSHVARSRQVFAAGALAAAEWLPGHVGIFTFDDMLFGGRS